MTKLKSKCCNATLKVKGDTTRYYVCINCQKPSDPNFPKNWGKVNGEDFNRDMPPMNIETTELNIGFLRQWLNEDRITDPKKMISNEDLKYWLTLKHDNK